MDESMTLPDMAALLGRETATAHQAVFGTQPVDDVSLAAIGLTVELWRNTTLEDLHAGTGAREQRDEDDELRRRYGWAPVQAFSGIPDPVMLQLNVSTFRQVRSALAKSGIDPDALGRRLLDERRVVTLGAVTVAVGELFAPVWEQLMIDEGGIATKLKQLSRFVTHFGPEATRQAAELFAQSYASHWFGTPWWVPGIDKAVESGLVPAELDVALLRQRPDRLGASEVSWLSWNPELQRHLDGARDAWFAERGCDPATRPPHPFVAGFLM
jgi:hypothetical protein